MEKRRIKPFFRILLAISLFLLLNNSFLPLSRQTSASEWNYQELEYYEGKNRGFDLLNAKKEIQTAPSTLNVSRHTFAHLGDSWNQELSLENWTLFQLKANHLSGGQLDLRLVILDVPLTQVLVNTSLVRAWLNVTNPTAINITLTAMDSNPSLYPAEYNIVILTSKILEITENTIISGLILFSESNFQLRVSSEETATVRLQFQVNDSSADTDLLTWSWKSKGSDTEGAATQGENGQVDTYRAVYPNGWLLASYSAIGDPAHFSLNCTAEITFEFKKVSGPQTHYIFSNFSSAGDSRLIEVIIPANVSSLAVTTESTGYLNYRLFNYTLALVASGYFLQWNISSQNTIFYLEITRNCGQMCYFENYTSLIRFEPEWVNLRPGIVVIENNFTDNWKTAKYRFYVEKGMQFKIADLSPGNKIDLVNSSSGLVIYRNWYLQAIFFHWKSPTRAFFFDASNYLEIWIHQYSSNLKDSFEIALSIKNTTVDSLPIDVSGDLRGIDDYDLWKVYLQENQEATFSAEGAGADMNLALLSETYRELVSSSDPDPSVKEKITYKAMESGYYYIRVSTPGGPGTYHLTGNYLQSTQKNQIDNLPILVLLGMIYFSLRHKRKFRRKQYSA
ncbi:MAG: PPC domain-containing protein [Candidatus Thorarchaeota archaeon]